jgi:predicted O-methyltransferase YrrM
MHLLLSYLSFLWKSKNEHGVHSPFVFDYVTKCFYDKTQHPEYYELKKYRKSLLVDTNFITVTDFGAGSRVFRSNKRQISRIAKTAGISEKRSELLFRLVRYFEPESILEIGTSLGLATLAMSLGAEKSQIISLEGCPETAAIAKRKLQNANCKNIEIINTEFSSFLQSNAQQPRTKTYDLIFFDGNHSESATLEYFNLLLPTITNETVWIFDDIHWSKDMEKAWEIIKKHPKVRVTLDTFRWGIVFFRVEQAKEHFVIRS